MKKLIIFILLFTLVGCEKMTEENGLYVFVEEQNVAPISIVSNADVPRLEELKQQLQDLEELQDVVIIDGEKELLITYKVKQLSRLKMKHIEKEVKKVAKEFLNEEKDVVVSSDYKIFLEAIRLHNESLNQVDEKKQLEKFEWIIKLQKEMT